LLALSIAASALRRDDGDRVDLSVALDAIDSGQVARATIHGRRVVIRLTDDRELHSGFPETYVDDLIAQLHRRRIPFAVETARWGLLPVLLLVPFGLFAVFWLWLARRLPRRRADA
jgi:hypothetical protein